MKSMASIVIGMSIAATATAADVHKIRAHIERPSWESMPWEIRQGPVDYTDETVSASQDVQAEFASMEPRKDDYSLFLDPQD